jgi:hypothetical protein
MEKIENMPKVAAVFVLDRSITQAEDDEEEFLRGVAMVRQFFALNADVHIVIVLSTTAGSTRVDRVETFIGADSFVSVLNLATADLSLLLSSYDSVVIIPESSLPCLGSALACIDINAITPKFGRIMLEDCELYSSSEPRIIIDTIKMFDSTKLWPQRAVHQSSRLHCLEQDKYEDVRTGVSRAQVEGNHGKPFLVGEAAKGDKSEQVKAQKQKRAMSNKGVALGLLAETEAERTALALAVTLMGALGFGLRWSTASTKKPPYLSMPDLEHMDDLILNGGFARDSIEPFTRKPKKEIKVQITFFGCIDPKPNICVILDGVQARALDDGESSAQRNVAHMENVAGNFSLRCDDGWTPCGRYLGHICNTGM